MMSGNIKSHFKTQKNAQSTPVAKAARTRSQAASQEQVPQPEGMMRSVGDAATSNLDVDAEERLLRGFDLDSRFGPCTGMSRMERWERAQKFGLSPPQEVRELLLAKGLGSPANRNLWHHRV